MKLSQHFTLEEMARGTPEEEIPQDVLENLRYVAVELLEPIRESSGLPVLVTSGYRTQAHNAAVGGASGSDHLTGSAADWRVNYPRPQWGIYTWEAFTWARKNLIGRFGQLIWEDHRIAHKNRQKLWIHISRPTSRHPGTSADPNRILVSSSSGHYERYHSSMEPLLW